MALVQGRPVTEREAMPDRAMKCSCGRGRAVERARSRMPEVADGGMCASKKGGSCPSSYGPSDSPGSPNTPNPERWEPGTTVLAHRPVSAPAGDRSRQAFLFRIAVEACHGAQPTGGCRTGAPAGFEIPSEAIDVRPAHAEQPPVVRIALGDELAQV